MPDTWSATFTTMMSLQENDRLRNGNLPIRGVYKPEKLCLTYSMISYSEGIKYHCYYLTHLPVPMTCRSQVNLKLDLASSC